jgi:hypothetical protein
MSKLEKGDEVMIKNYKNIQKLERELIKKKRQTWRKIFD